MHGEFIIYVDESGEPNPSPSDANNPMFVLAFCIFNKNEYANQITPAMQALKFQHFGHDIVILHEREIRKAMPPFQFLMNTNLRMPFFVDLNRIMSDSPFWIVAAAIQKHLLSPSDLLAENLYHLALQIGLEGVHKFLDAQSQLGGSTHFVFESRGRKEDKELELEFRRVCDGENSTRTGFPFEFVIASKMVNSCGLQLADLVARPIARYVLKPNQPNRAFEILKTKFWTWKSDAGEEVWSLHIHP